MKTLNFESKEEKGPGVLELLKNAGIRKFSRVTFVSIYKNKLSLPENKVTADTLLDITNHGTVKLVTKSVKKKDWIKDIENIIVEE